MQECFAVTDDQFNRMHTMFEELRKEQDAGKRERIATAIVKFFDRTEHDGDEDDHNVLPPPNPDTLRNRLSDFVSRFSQQNGGPTLDKLPWQLLPERAFRYVRFPIEYMGLLLYFGGDLDQGVISYRSQSVFQPFRMSDAIR
jgi:hypothetical protein